VLIRMDCLDGKVRPSWSREVEWGNNQGRAKGGGLPLGLMESRGVLEQSQLKLGRVRIFLTHDKRNTLGPACSLGLDRGGGETASNLVARVGEKREVTLFGGRARKLTANQQDERG